jgi:hypothetical protein
MPPLLNSQHRSRSRLAKTSPSELRREGLRQVFTHQPERAITEAANALEKATPPPSSSPSPPRHRQMTMPTKSAIGSIKLAQHKAPAAIQLDILEAAATRDSLKDKLDRNSDATTPNSSKAAM